MSQIKTATLSLWVEGALPGYVSPKAAGPWRQTVFLCWTQGEPRPCCLWSQFSSGQFQVTERLSRRVVTYDHSTRCHLFCCGFTVTARHPTPLVADFPARWFLSLAEVAPTPSPILPLQKMCFSPQTNMKRCSAVSPVGMAVWVTVPEEQLPLEPAL